MSDDDLGTCDGCGTQMGTRGWMRDSGETLTLDGTELPVWRFFCSRECADSDPPPDQQPTTTTPANTGVASILET